MGDTLVIPGASTPTARNDTYGPGRPIPALVDERVLQDMGGGEW